METLRVQEVALDIGYALGVDPQGPLSYHKSVGRLSCQWTPVVSRHGDADGSIGFPDGIHQVNVDINAHAGYFWTQ